MSINLQAPSLTILAAKRAATLGLSRKALEDRLSVQALGYVQAQSQGLNLASLTELFEEKPFLYKEYINLIETGFVGLKGKTIAVFTRLNIKNHLYHNTVNHTLSGSEMAKTIVRVYKYLEASSTDSQYLNQIQPGSRHIALPLFPKRSTVPFTMQWFLVEPPSPKGEGFLVLSSEQPRQLPRL